MFDLKNKVAVVTGGNGVLGGAIAKGFAQNGVKVGILGRSEETVNKQVEAINTEGGEAFPLVCDVLDEAKLKETRDFILKKYGRIDILLNGAGGNVKGATISPEQTFFGSKLGRF